MDCVHHVQQVIGTSHLAKVLVVTNARYSACKKMNSRRKRWWLQYYKTNEATFTCNIADHTVWQTYHLELDAMYPFVAAEKSALSFDQLYLHAPILKSASEQQITRFCYWHLLKMSN